MNPTLALATAGRVMRQLRADHRTMAMMLVVPCVLIGLLAWIFTSTPVFDQIGAPLGRLHGGHPYVTADRGQQRGLAAGPGAQIQPAPAVGPVELGQRQSPGHQLAALVLHQRGAVADRLQPTRIPAGQVDRVRRVAADGAAHLLGELLGGQHPGPRRQVHRRALVVAFQQRLQFVGPGA